jgi:hypothetical protein
VPRRQESRERLLLDRLDLAGAAPRAMRAQAAQYVGIAPLALAAARAQLAAHEQLLALELARIAPTSRPKRLVRRRRS